MGISSEAFDFKKQQHPIFSLWWERAWQPLSDGTSILQTRRPPHILFNSWFLTGLWLMPVVNPTDCLFIIIIIILVQCKMGTMLCGTPQRLVDTALQDFVF